MRAFEYAAYCVQQKRQLLQRLHETEALIEDERGTHGDKARRKEAEARASQLRIDLLEATDPTTIYQYLKSTGLADADLLKTTWQHKSLVAKVDMQYKDLLDQPFDISLLPSYSFAIQFTFTLAKPYISRDDTDFYVIDNPIVREKVFRWPMVRPSSWKGSLHAALWQLGYQNDDQIYRIFGALPENREDDGPAQRGRLQLYQTYFDRTSLEIINPHTRKQRSGKVPILFESVPEGTSGTFTLLYVPFDRIGHGDDMETRQQVAADLRLVTTGVTAMMTTYGFGAKTSSGCGVVDDRLQNGVIHLAGIDEPSQTQNAAENPSVMDLPRYLCAPNVLQPELRADDGTLIDEVEYQQRLSRQGQPYSKKQQQYYHKAKNWWDQECKALLEHGTPEPDVPDVTPITERPQAHLPFTNWTTLHSKAAHAATLLEEARP